MPKYLLGKKISIKRLLLHQKKNRRPIRWPDGETLGTICVLDNKKNEFEKKYREMIQIYQQVIEDDLELLISKNK